MIINPIIPIWLMTIICILILVFKRKSAGSFVRQILIVLLLFVINLRFMVRDGDVPMLSPKVDVLFVVDNTISMLAEDYNDAGARRIDAVRNDCRYILENLPGATVSVWTFDNAMEIQIPYTEDVNAVNNCLAILEGPSSYHAKGTSLNIVMEKMKDVLNDDRPYYQVVFFISDGEIVSASDLKSYPGLNVFVDNGAVLGYGTEKGGKMLVKEWYQEEDEAEYLEYYEGYSLEVAVSKMNEKNLKSIASDLGIPYVHMTSRGEIDKVLDEIRGEIVNLPMEIDENSMDGYKDIYYWFVIPLAVLLVWDLISFKKKLRGN